MNALITEQEQEMEEDVTTDKIVLSMAHVDQRFEDAMKASSADKLPTTGRIVQSMASIHRLFDDVMSKSNSMQKVCSDVVDIALKIRIQKVAFDNGCKLLLVIAAKSRQDVDNMVEDPRHPVWTDTIAHRNIQTGMARFYHPCLAALEHFEKSLSKLSLGLHSLRRQRKRQAGGRYQFWLNWSKSSTTSTTENFPKLVENLRHYNDIFCALAWQVVRRRSNNKLESLFGEDMGCSYAEEPARESHHHFGCMQRASQVFYDTLSKEWTYLDYEVQLMHISLNFDFARAAATLPDKDFHFNVVVISRNCHVPYRLLVDIAHDEFCEYQTVGEDRCSKKYLGDKVARLAALTKSLSLSEIHADHVAHQARNTRTGASMRTYSLQHMEPDVGLERDFCCRLRGSSGTVESRQQTAYLCHGYLENENVCRILLPDDEYQSQGSHSLDDVLVRAHNERRTIPLHDRLRTALFLAAGVLHLNTSSWLRQAWSSKDVQFFERRDCESCTLGEPFLQTRLESNMARRPVYQVENFNATRSCVFSLGLVLIELAFSAPWRKLQLEEDITKDLMEWESNLLNLLRLKDTVSRELGSRYAKVVQTCLFQGLAGKETNSLGKAEFDEIIFKDIVRELDRCLTAVTQKSGVYDNPSRPSFADYLASELVIPSAETPGEDYGD